MLIEDKHDILWLRTLGTVALRTVGVCGCSLPTLVNCFITECGQEPSAKVQTFLREIASLNAARMRAQGACIGPVEIAATIARTIGVIAPEQAACESPE